MKVYFLLPLFFLMTMNGFGQKTALPACVQAFLDPAPDSPFGKINENAPAELAQFGRLAGVWEMTAHAEWQGQWYSGWPSIWAWKYVLDGSNILDFFYRSKENTPPNAPKKMDIHAFNLRVYNPETNSWTITWAANNSGEFRYQAKAKGDEIWMTPLGTDQGNIRIIFSDMTEDSFKWRVENQDSSGNWAYKQYLIGKRIL